MTKKKNRTRRRRALEKKIQNNTFLPELTETQQKMFTLTTEAKIDIGGKTFNTEDFTISINDTTMNIAIKEEMAKKAKIQAIQKSIGLRRRIRETPEIDLSEFKFKDSVKKDVQMLSKHKLVESAEIYKVGDEEIVKIKTKEIPVSYRNLNYVLPPHTISIKCSTAHLENVTPNEHYFLNGVVWVNQDHNASPHPHIEHGHLCAAQDVQDAVFSAARHQDIYQIGILTLNFLTRSNVIYPRTCAAIEKSKLEENKETFEKCCFSGSEVRDSLSTMQHTDKSLTVHAFNYEQKKAAEDPHVEADVGHSHFITR